MITALHQVRAVRAQSQYFIISVLVLVSSHLFLPTLPFAQETTKQLIYMASAFLRHRFARLMTSAFIAGAGCSAAARS